jgi:hypothetical protein
LGLGPAPRTGDSARRPAVEVPGTPSPGGRIRRSEPAWKSIEGTDNGGAVLFTPIDPGMTRVTLRIDAEPEGLVESAGEALGFLQRRVAGDLERFKEFIEGRAAPTGAWRGEIHGDEVRPDPVAGRGRVF